MRASGADLPRFGKVQRAGRTLSAPPKQPPSWASVRGRMPSPGRRLRTPGPPAQTRLRDRSVPFTPRLQSQRVCGHWGPLHPAPGGAEGRGATVESGMVPPRRAAPRLAARGRRMAGGGGSHSALQVAGGARAGEGSRRTAADSDPGRAGPRRSAAATRSPGARKCELSPAPPPARPPARRPARAGPRKEGRRPPRQVGAERGPHPAPRRRRRLGGPGCGTCGPDPGTVVAAQAPPSPSESCVPARARQAGREPRVAAAGRGPGLTSALIAGHSVPDRGTGVGGAVARGRTAAVAAPAAHRAGGAGAAAWAARRPELSPRCRRSRRRAQPARPPTGFLR